MCGVVYGKRQMANRAVIAILDELGIDISSAKTKWNQDERQI